MRFSYFQLLYCFKCDEINVKPCNYLNFRICVVPIIFNNTKAVSIAICFPVPGGPLARIFYVDPHKVVVPIADVTSRMGVSDGRPMSDSQRKFHDFI